MSVTVAVIGRVIDVMRKRASGGIAPPATDAAPTAVTWVSPPPLTPNTAPGKRPEST